MNKSKILFLTIMFLFLVQIAAAAPPSGVIDYLNISLNNQQASAISAGTQIMITFNGLNYTSYFNGNTINLEVFNGLTGNILYSWFEGNQLNELQTAGFNGVSNDIIWVVLPSQIAASTDAVNVLSIGFLTITSTALNGNNMGMAPQLYCASGCPQSSYAEYDNGANVFSYYQSFGGSLSALPAGWADFGDAFTTTFSATNTEISSTVSLSNWGGINTVTPSSLNAYPNILDSLQASVSPTQQTFGYCDNTGASGNCGNSNAIRSIGTGMGTCTSSAAICFTNIGTQTQLTESFSTAPSVYSIESPSQSTANILMTYNQIYVATGLSTSLLNNWIDYAVANAEQYYIYWTRGREYPPNNIMPTVTASAVTASSSLSITINPSSMTYGSTSTITATCLPSTDTCDVDAPLGTHLCTGTGTCSYTTPILAAGTYTYYANDITAVQTKSGTLTVNKATPAITLPSFPANFIYNGNGAIITANIVTLFNQVQANDFINSASLAAFITQNTFTETNAGTYVIVANSLATANYIAASVTNTLVISPLTVNIIKTSGIFLYGTNNLITATSNDPTETVRLYIGGTLVASGTGSASYNAIQWTTAGVWNVIANTPLAASSNNINYGINKIADVNPPVQIAAFVGINFTQIYPASLFAVNSLLYETLENSNFNNMVWFLANGIQLQSTLTSNNLITDPVTTYNVIMPADNINTSIAFIGFAYSNSLSYSNPAFSANFTVNTLAPAGLLGNGYVTNPLYSIAPPTLSTGNYPTLYGAYNPINSIEPGIYYTDKFTALYPNSTVAFSISNLQSFNSNANILPMSNLTIIANNTHTYQTNTINNFNVFPVLLYGTGNTVLPTLYTNTVTAFTTTNTVHALNFFFVNLSSNKPISGNVENVISQMAGFINLTANNSAGQYYKGQIINGSHLGLDSFTTSFNATDVYQIDKFCANSMITQNLNLLNGQLQYESTANIISYFTFSNTRFDCGAAPLNETVYLQTNASDVGQFNFYVQQGIAQIPAVLQIYLYNINTNKYQLLDYINSPQEGTTVTIELPNNKPYTINIYQPNTNKLLGTVQTSLTCASSSICTFPLVIQNITLTPFKSISNIYYNCTYDQPALQESCTATDPTSVAQGYQLLIQTQGALSSYNVCNQSSTGAYGTLTCSNINASAHGYEYTLYVKYPFTKYVITSGTLGNLSQNKYGTAGILIVLLVLIVLSFMAMWNPQFVIIMDVVAVFVTMILQLWVFGLAMFVQLLIIGILYLYKLRQ